MTAGGPSGPPNGYAGNAPTPGVIARNSAAQRLPEYSAAGPGHPTHPLAGVGAACPKSVVRQAFPAPTGKGQRVPSVLDDLPEVLSSDPDVTKGFLLELHDAMRPPKPLVLDWEPPVSGRELLDSCYGPVNRQVPPWLDPDVQDRRRPGTATTYSSAAADELVWKPSDAQHAEWEATGRELPVIHGKPVLDGPARYFPLDRGLPTSFLLDDGWYSAHPQTTANIVTAALATKVLMDRARARATDPAARSSVARSQQPFADVLADRYGALCAEIPPSSRPWLAVLREEHPPGAATRRASTPQQQQRVPLRPR